MLYGYCQQSQHVLKMSSFDANANIDELKQRLIEVWKGMQQSVLDNTIDEWRKRLISCIRAKGGHFEHIL